MCAASAAKPETAPFPWRAMLILIAVNLTEPIVMAVLFPMAPFMVAEWVPHDSVGTWAGLLTSAFNLASVPAGIFWGRISDRVGRRPAMLWMLFGSALSMIVFGTAGSLAHAMVARLLGGLFSGIGGLVAATIRELTTESQRSFAVSSTAWAFGVGFCIGPMMGGFLIRPVASPEPQPGPPRDPDPNPDDPDSDPDPTRSRMCA